MTSRFPTATLDPPAGHHVGSWRGEWNSMPISFASRACRKLGGLGAPVKVQLGIGGVVDR